MTHELDRIIRRLIEHNVEFVVIGGFTAVLHGSPLLTADVDICLHFTRENLNRLVLAVQDLHPVHRITPQRIPFEVTESNWASLQNLYLETDMGILDCLGEVKGIGSYSDVLKVSEPFTGLGGCRILTLNALILAKEALGRPKDLIAVTYLRAINGKKNRD